MAQKKTLEARGLFTDPNLISKVPEGALVVADNVIIDRDAVIEPRRGFNQYGTPFGADVDRAKQFLVYKDRILVHYDSALAFNDNPHTSANDGSFLDFNGTYEETESGLRIKGAESNKNFYFTTADGIKKISATTASDFSTSAGYIIDAGGLKALDLTGNLNTQNSGFLPPNSKVAYRLVWGYKDANDVLVIGSPSSRLVITNYGTTSANVDLQFVIPTTYNDLNFFQMYRSAVFTATGSIGVDDINPGDEMQLIIEDFPTAAQKTANLVTLTDITPEDFRAGGAFLYTNPDSGEGINQANEPPPIAKDITLYQNTMFYANTQTRARTTVSLLGVANLTSGVSEFIIDDGVNPAQTYTFVGEKETTNYDFSGYTGIIPDDLDGSYFLMNSSSNVRKYYVWYDNTKTTQTLDFSGYVGTVPGDMDGDYVVFYTPTARGYYVWFDSTGTTDDPGSNPQNVELTNLISIKADITGATTLGDVAAASSTALTTNNVFNDYDISYTALDEFLIIETESFDLNGIEVIETIEQGFEYTITTPANSDPANTPLINTDVDGRSGFKVSVARGVTTKAELADATAAAIADQDAALDFLVDYTALAEDFDITNTNNGNTEDAVDSAITPIGNGFSITITTQGDGEDPLTNAVLLSAAATPAQQIDETARSLVNIINKNASESVSAFYISGPSDIPGQFLLEVRDIGTSTFSITANDATTGAQFNPPLPPAVGASAVVATAETKPNRLMYSKLQQPEAVPLLNFVDVGPEDQAISRILSLRESLFILKEDGIYRLTGLNGVFTVDLFDASTKIISPDTAVVLNNQIYCLTNQGVAVISDTGVDIISKRLDNVIQVLTSSNYNFKYTSFGVSYETDRSYTLWLPSVTTDTVATQAYRYNTAEDTWTRLTLAKTCGIVNRGDDKLYLGPTDENFVERERKHFNRTDYADREFDLEIPPESIDGTTVTLSQVNIAEVGDALTQIQNLTINQYNQLLKKLDLDPFTGSPEDFTVDFTGYTGTIPGDLHTKYFIMYSASDSVKYAVFYDAIGNVLSLDTTVFSELVGAIQIRIDVSALTTLAEVVDATQNTIKTITQDFVVSYINGQTLFNAITVRNGETTDPADSTVNGLNNGFSIVINGQGTGDYFSTLQASAGDNLTTKLNALAIKLDLDPSVVATDFFATVSGFPTTFVGIQDAFNAVIGKLNVDAGTLYTNYILSEGTTEFEVLVFDAQVNTSVVELQYALNYVEGPIVLYKSIKSTVLYAPETFSDPSLLKHIREGTVMFENATFTRGEVGYKSDLSPGVESIEFFKSGKGDWGSFVWGDQNWGGGFSGVPFRTYIPRSKQRCRYIQCQFAHSSAREKWAIFGISYTLKATSPRGYRDNG